MTITLGKLKEIINEVLAGLGLTLDSYTRVRRIEPHKFIPKKKRFWHDGPSYDSWHFEVLFRFCIHDFKATVFYNDKFSLIEAQQFIQAIEAVCPVDIGWTVSYVYSCTPTDCVSLTKEP